MNLSFREIDHYSFDYQRTPGVSFGRKTREGILFLLINPITMNLIKHNRNTQSTPLHTASVQRLGDRELFTPASRATRYFF